MDKTVHKCADDMIEEYVRGSDAWKTDDARDQLPFPTLGILKDLLLAAAERNGRTARHRQPTGSGECCAGTYHTVPRTIHNRTNRGNASFGMGRNRAG